MKLLAQSEPNGKKKAFHESVTSRLLPLLPTKKFIARSQSTGNINCYGETDDGFFFSRESKFLPFPFGLVFGATPRGKIFVWLWSLTVLF